MRFSWMIIVAALCLGAATATSTSALAGLSQTVSRSASSTQTVNGSKARVSDAKPGATKSSSVTTAATKKKDRPGGRFWARIMNTFREVHSAEKKQK